MRDHGSQAARPYPILAQAHERAQKLAKHFAHRDYPLAHRQVHRLAGEPRLVQRLLVGVHPQTMPKVDARAYWPDQVGLASSRHALLLPYSSLRQYEAGDLRYRSRNILR